MPTVRATCEGLSFKKGGLVEIPFDGKATSLTKIKKDYPRTALQVQEDKVTAFVKSEFDLAARVDGKRPIKVRLATFVKAWFFACTEDIQKAFKVTMPAELEVDRRTRGGEIYYVLADKAQEEWLTRLSAKFPKLKKRIEDGRRFRLLRDAMVQANTVEEARTKVRMLLKDQTEALPSLRALDNGKWRLVATLKTGKNIKVEVPAH